MVNMSDFFENKGFIMIDAIMIIHIQNGTDLVSKPCKTRLVQTSYTTIQLEVAVLDQEVKRSHKKLQNEHCTILQ